MSERADRLRAVGYGAVALLVFAAFPRLAYGLGGRARVSPRGVIAYIALNTALGFAVRAGLLPFFRRMEEKRAQAEGELRRQLGREPTERELFAHLGIPVRH